MDQVSILHVSSSRKNGVDSENVINVPCAPWRFNDDQEVFIFNELENPCDDQNALHEICKLNDYVENVVTYIAGFVVKSLSNKLHCEICVSALTNKNIENKKFAQLINMKTKGGLTYPSEDVIFVCQKAEKLFR